MGRGRVAEVVGAAGEGCFSTGVWGKMVSLVLIQSAFSCCSQSMPDLLFTYFESPFIAALRNRARQRTDQWKRWTILILWFSCRKFSSGAVLGRKQTGIFVRLKVVQGKATV